jgi:L,D-transpeptidase ErfK/SrfK
MARSVIGAFLVFLQIGALAGPAVAQDVIGALAHMKAREKDTLYDIARRENLGIAELLAANPGIDPWMLYPGQEILMPKAHVLPDGPREGIVINLADQRLYFFPPGGTVLSFPVGIGRAGSETPPGETTIVGKRENPSWRPPESIRAENPHLPKIVPPGPGNPLGGHALDLGWAGYVIHGTNKPYGIGRRVSHGCIRLNSQDAELLYALVPLGTAVRIVDQPVKIGWKDGRLYLEIHPSQAQCDEIVAREAMTFAEIPDLMSRLLQKVEGDADSLDWRRIDRIAEERRGIPYPISR